MWGIHRGPVNSPHKWPVTRKIFPFDDVIMLRIFYRIDDAFVNDLLILKHFCNNAHPVESLSVCTCSFNLLSENFADIICRVYIIILDTDVKYGWHLWARKKVGVKQWDARPSYEQVMCYRKVFQIQVSDATFFCLCRSWSNVLSAYFACDYSCTRMGDIMWRG